MVNEYTRRALAEDVKREVLMELNQHHHGQVHYSNQALVEAVKNEVLTDMRNLSHHPDRAMIESIKREVIAQMRGEHGGHREEGHEQEEGQIAPQGHEQPYGQMYGQQTGQQHYGAVDPALVQAVKDSVMAEMGTSYRR